MWSRQWASSANAANARGRAISVGGSAAVQAGRIFRDEPKKLLSGQDLLSRILQEHLYKIPSSSFLSAGARDKKSQLPKIGAREIKLYKGCILRFQEVSSSTNYYSDVKVDKGSQAQKQAVSIVFSSWLSSCTRELVSKRYWGVQRCVWWNRRFYWCHFLLLPTKSWHGTFLPLSVSFCTGGQVSLIVSLEDKMGSYLACCATTCLVWCFEHVMSFCDDGAVRGFWD